MQNDMMRIMAVDDEDLVIRLLDGTLSSLGYNQVEFAKSGAEALAMAERSAVPYDCFLLDIRMPEMDGVELCRRIRSMDVYRETPIIMLTAMKETHFVEDSFAAGATDYLTKPIDKVELGARLRVVNLLLEEQDKAAQFEASAHAMQLQTPYPASFELADAITLLDVPRVISALAIENYLLQLSRNDAFKHAAIGFQIEKAGTHFRRMGREDFYYMLTDVADAIFEATRGVNPLIAYYGDGSFVAVVPRVNNFEPEELGLIINAELGDSFASVSPYNTKNVFVSAGPQINASLFGFQAQDMILRAIDSAQPEEQRHNPSPRGRSLLSALTA